MARYGDLYTPASNYGQVYRGSLASRQKSVEQAGQNMKDFAGEIYNLVDRQRQRKAQEAEQQSLERERASLQASRKARVEYDKEQQNFQNYISRLNSITKLHNQEQKLIDAKMFPFWGGIENTRKAYKDRVKLFQDAYAEATGNEARQRAVLNNYSDLFPRLAEKDPETGEYVHSRPVTKNADGTGYVLPFSQLEALQMMSEGTYVESMRDRNVTGTNKYTPGLEATLRHPRYGFGDMLVEVETSRREVERAQKVSKSADDGKGIIKKIITDGSGPEKPEEENPESSVITSIIGNANAAEIGEDIPEITEEETPGYFFQELSEEQLDETFDIAESKYKWLGSTSDKRFQGVDLMFSIIGFYLQDKGEADTPQARIAEFDKMKKTRGLLNDVNSKPEDIFAEFKNHVGFKNISPDSKNEFNLMMEELRSTLRVGPNILYAGPGNKYTDEQMVEDLKSLLPNEQKSRKRRPARNRNRVKKITTPNG